MARKPGSVVGRPAGSVLAGIAAVLLVVSTMLLADEGGTYLKPPGLRLRKDPSVVIPADYFYANHVLNLPHYRNQAGRPAQGWQRKYIPTRRFRSDQSAWIYYRSQDLQKAAILAPVRQGARGMCIWPGGSLIVIESYQGSAPVRPAHPPLEIAVMSKSRRNTMSSGDLFFAAEWSYARFTPSGERSSDSAIVHECHQCHAIAFQLTGDLVFTRFP